MEQTSKTDLENELKERLENEIEARSKKAAKAEGDDTLGAIAEEEPDAHAEKNLDESEKETPAAESAPDSSSKTDASAKAPDDENESEADPKEQQRLELEKKLRRELEAELGSLGKDKGQKSRVELEEELRRELEAELAQPREKGKTADKKAATEEAKTEEKKTSSSEKKKSTDAKSQKDQAGGAKAKQEGADKESKPRKKRRKPQRKKTKGATTRVAGRTGTRTTRPLSEKDLKLIEEKARIDKKLKKLKYFLYILIPILSLGLFALAILPNFFQKDDDGPMEIRRIIKQPDQTGDNGLGGSNTDPLQAASGGPAGAPEPITVVDVRTLKQEVNRLLAAKEFQDAVDTISQYSDTHPNDRVECRRISTEIAERYLNAANAGSRDWRTVRDRARQLAQGENADNLQQAITALGNFWNTHPDERFVADYLIRKYTAQFVDQTNRMPNDTRNL